MEWFQRWNIETLSQLNEKDTCCVYWRFWVSNLDLEASYPACWRRVRLSGFVLHPLIPSPEVGGICTRVAQKILKPLIYFSQYQQEMCANFSMADFEYPTGSCSTVEQNIFLHMRRGLPKWHGMVMCILNNGLVNWISCGREEISNDHSEEVKNICGVGIVDNNIVSR